MFIRNLKNVEYNSQMYDTLQMKQIIKGLASGLDVSVYENPEYDVEIMSEIRRGLLYNIDMSEYVKALLKECGADGVKATAAYMKINLVRRGLSYGFDIVKSAESYGINIYDEDYSCWRLIYKGLRDRLNMIKIMKPNYTIDQKWEVLQGLQKGIDISVFDQYNMSDKQMHQLVKSMVAGVDLISYISAEGAFSAKQMAAIRKGLVRGYDVSVYANINTSSTMMNIYLKALDLNFDIKPYVDMGLSAPQINEVLYGVKRGLEIADIKEYANPQYTAEEMRKKCNEIIKIDTES